MASSSFFAIGPVMSEQDVVTRILSEVDTKLVEMQAEIQSNVHDGADAYTIAVSAGFSGTRGDWLASLKGDKGTVGASWSNGVYNGSNQLIGYTQGGVTYTMTYGANGIATKTGGGVTVTYQYDGSGNLTGETWA